MSKPSLICMVGLPRSGKSTIVGPLSKTLGAPIVRRDAIRLAVHGQRYAPEAEPLIKVLDLYMIRSLFLASHETVIVDETCFSRAARNHLRSDSWETIFYPVSTDFAECQRRAITTNQPDLVNVIAEMAARWEDFEPDDLLLQDVTDDGTIVTIRANAR